LSGVSGLRGHDQSAGLHGGDTGVCVVAGEDLRAGSDLGNRNISAILDDAAIGAAGVAIADDQQAAALTASDEIAGRRLSRIEQSVDRLGGSVEIEKGLMRSVDRVHDQVAGWPECKA